MSITTRRPRFTRVRPSSGSQCASSFHSGPAKGNRISSGVYTLKLKAACRCGAPDQAYMMEWAQHTASIPLLLQLWQRQQRGTHALN